MTYLQRQAASRAILGLDPDLADQAPVAVQLGAIRPGLFSVSQPGKIRPGRLAVGLLYFGGINALEPYPVLYVAGGQQGQGFTVLYAHHAAVDGVGEDRGGKKPKYKRQWAHRLILGIPPLSHPSPCLLSEYGKDERP